MRACLCVCVHWNQIMIRTIAAAFATTRTANNMWSRPLETFLSKDCESVRSQSFCGISIINSTAVTFATTCPSLLQRQRQQQRRRQRHNCSRMTWFSCLSFPSSSSFLVIIISRFFSCLSQMTKNYNILKIRRKLHQTLIFQTLLSEWKKNEEE